jgi:hypothetical protein
MDEPLNIEKVLATLPAEQAPVPELFDFEKAKIRIGKLIGAWQSDVMDAKTRRKERYIELDVEQLQEEGLLLADEVIIPDRVIDTNIVKEKSDAMAFLNSGYRLAIFDCVSNPEVNTLQLDLEVTKGLTYKGWYREFDRVVDGAMLHRDDCIEVVFDETKPLHVGFEHVGFDNLYYDKAVSNIQDSEFLIRKYEVNMMQLEKFLKNGFDAAQVGIITTANAENRDKNICIFKVFTKLDNCVYVAWYTNESGITGWLKAPEKLQLGISEEQESVDPMTGQTVSSWVPAEIDSYPVFQYIYRDDEQEVLVDKKGRGFLDAPSQEANTTIISAFVNGSTRASNVYASPKTDDGETAEMKQLDVKLRNGAIYSKPLEFWHTDFPDMQMLQAVQFLDTKNSTQLGKIAGAVVNRKDSRKTAKELEQAGNQEQKIIGTNLATFSEFLRDVLSFAWRIIQSQALQDKIGLLLMKQPVYINPEMPEMGVVKNIWVNNKEVLAETFDVRPAGDTDVVEAQEEIAKFQQDWPVLQTTALAAKLIEDYVRVRYPKKANEYIAILQAGDPGKKLVGSLLQLLQGFAQPEEVAALPPQDQANLEQIVMQATTFIQGAPAK